MTARKGRRGKDGEERKEMTARKGRRGKDGEVRTARKGRNRQRGNDGEVRPSFRSCKTHKTTSSGYKHLPLHLSFKCSLNP